MRGKKAKELRRAVRRELKKRGFPEGYGEKESMKAVKRAYRARNGKI